MCIAARFESCYVALIASLWAEMKVIFGQHYAEDAAHGSAHRTAEAAADGVRTAGGNPLR